MPRIYLQLKRHPCHKALFSFVEIGLLKIITKTKRYKMIIIQAHEDYVIMSLIILSLITLGTVLHVVQSERNVPLHLKCSIRLLSKGATSKTWSPVKGQTKQIVESMSPE